LLRECHRVLQPNGLLVLGLPIESNLVNSVRRHRYFYHHPGHLYSFSLENIEILLQKAGFETIRFYFEPRIVPGNLWLSLLQRMPSTMAHKLALAYWVVARKTEAPTGREASLKTELTEGRELE
jgi:SAM-dependent methyltransferase